MHSVLWRQCELIFLFSSFSFWSERNLTPGHYPFSHLFSNLLHARAFARLRPSSSALSAGSCLSALSDGRAFDPVGVWLPGSCYVSSQGRGKLNLTFSGKMVSPTPAPGNAPLTGKQHVKCRRVQSERVASVTGCHCLGACDSVLEEPCACTRKCTYGR